MVCAATVNPARAGMILKAIRLVVETWGKPRASGDDPSNAPVGSAP